MKFVPSRLTLFGSIASQMVTWWQVRAVHAAKLLSTHVTSWKVATKVTNCHTYLQMQLHYSHAYLPQLCPWEPAIILSGVFSAENRNRRISKIPSPNRMRATATTIKQILRDTGARESRAIVMKLSSCGDSY